MYFSSRSSRARAFGPGSGVWIRGTGRPSNCHIERLHYANEWSRISKQNRLRRPTFDKVSKRRCDRLQLTFDGIPSYNVRCCNVCIDWMSEEYAIGACIRKKEKIVETTL